MSTKNVLSGRRRVSGSCRFGLGSSMTSMLRAIWFRSRSNPMPPEASARTFASNSTGEPGHRSDEYGIGLRRAFQRMPGCLCVARGFQDVGHQDPLAEAGREVLTVAGAASGYVCPINARGQGIRLVVSCLALWRDDTAIWPTVAPPLGRQLRVRWRS